MPINSYCYICGKCEANSDDHIPPKCLFPTRFHKSIPHVPAHSTCNIQLSKEDTYLRDCFTLACAHTNKIAKEVFHDTVVRSWTRPQAKTYWKYLKSQLSIIKSPYPNTELYKLDADRIKSQICRITRGLFYYHYGKPMNLNLKLDAYLIIPNYFSQLFINTFGESIVNKSFKYSIVIPNQNIVLGKVIMCFYEHLWFQVNISN